MTFRESLIGTRVICTDDFIPSAQSVPEGWELRGTWGTQGGGSTPHRPRRYGPCFLDGNTAMVSRMWPEDVKCFSMRRNYIIDAEVSTLMDGRQQALWTPTLSLFRAEPATADSGLHGTWTHRQNFVTDPQKRHAHAAGVSALSKRHAGGCRGGSLGSSFPTREAPCVCTGSRTTMEHSRSSSSLVAATAEAFPSRAGWQCRASGTATPGTWRNMAEHGGSLHI